MSPIVHANFQDHGRRRFLKVLAIYGCGDLGHLTKTIFIDLCPHFPRRLHIKFGFDWLSVSEKKMFENNGHIHVYSPGAGADKPLESINKSSVSASFSH